MNFRLNALPFYSADNFRIYKGHFSVHFVGIPITWTHKTVKVKNVYPYDSSPGGFFDIPLDINPADYPFLEFAIDNENIKVDIVRFNYIPTFSALNLPNPYKTNPYASLASIPPTDRVLNNVSGTYTGIFGDVAELQNTLHIRLYNRNAQWLLYNLVGSDNINNSTSISSGSYNFGQGNISDLNHFENTPFQVTTTKIDNLTNISGSAQVFVNKNNRIGFILTDNAPYTVHGTPSEPTNFIVHVKPECEEEDKDLFIQSGALFYIGENQDQTGELHIHSGTGNFTETDPLFSLQTDPTFSLETDPTFSV